MVLQLMSCRRRKHESYSSWDHGTSYRDVKVGVPQGSHFYNSFVLPHLEYCRIIEELLPYQPWEDFYLNNELQALWL